MTKTNIERAAGNGRFCEMAAVTPQTILWKIERLSPAGTLVEAATSQSRFLDVAQSASLLAPHRPARLQRFVVLAASRTAHIKPFDAIAGGGGVPHSRQVKV